MPTYEYACQKCGHHFEQFQSMRDEPLKKCPKCQKNGLKRLLGSGAGLIFKGSGFYITDYKNKSGAKEGGGEAKSGGAVEAKPASSSAGAAAAKTPGTGSSGSAGKSASKTPKT
jgi:putative FmdB family regulatory protein